MQRQYKQEKQMQMNDKALIKDDNRVFRVQNPIRQELSLSVFFLVKAHISRSVKKTAEAHPRLRLFLVKSAALGGNLSIKS